MAFNKEDILKKAVRPIQPLPSVGKRKAQLQKPKAASWHDIPPARMTPELQNDLRLLQLRHALDPHRHYKRDRRAAALSGKNGEHCVQVGTIIEAPDEFYSARLSRKQRSGTLVDTLLKDEASRSQFKKKFLTLQSKSQAGDQRSFQKRRNVRLNHKAKKVTKK